MTDAHITPFLFEGERMVRATERDGAAWFAGIDVCRILDIRDHHQALERLDEDERGRCIVPTPSGDQDMIVISEAGVYQLAFTSRKPVAVRFRRWLAHEVIPAIRKNGFYAAPHAEVIPAPLEHRPFPDWPMEEIRTKRGVVDMYRMLYGVMAAQWISPQVGFPAPPIEMVDHGRQMKFALVPAE